MEKLEVKATSESENEENGGAENGGAIAKKRGRPPKKGAKAVKEKSGRGRGRPPMNPEDKVERLSKAKEPDSANGISNGKRGRPKKGGGYKVGHKIVATGKGRGRPKADNGENDAESPVAKSKKSPKGGRGRPKKDDESDEGRSADDVDESNNEDDDDEDHRPIGRPATGAVNLNIQRTGRGQGRPKKRGEKRSATDKDEGTPKKRGRPAGGAASKSATGKPRGRPKAEKSGAEENSDNGEESDNDNENDEANSPPNQYESVEEDAEEDN